MESKELYSIIFTVLQTFGNTTYKNSITLFLNKNFIYEIKSRTHWSNMKEMQTPNYFIFPPYKDALNTYKCYVK